MKFLDQIVGNQGKMKLAILGATGMTGQLCVQRALDKGHTVTAIVRSPEKITVVHDNLTVVTGNIFDADDLAAHFGGCDCVLSCLGTTTLSAVFSEVTFFSDSARAVVAAMDKANVKRFVFTSSWGVESQEVEPWYIAAFFKTVIRRALEDMRRMENYLRDECPRVDFTSVRCPGLNNDTISGAALVKAPGMNYSTKLKRSIPRANVAAGLLEILEGNLFVRECVGVGLPDT